MQRTEAHEERPSRAQEGLYQFEHWASWLMGAVAVTLLVIGLLVGFDILGTEGGEIQFREEQLEPGQGSQQQTQAADDSFRDASLFLLPAIAAGFLALTLHMNEHHRFRNMGRRGEGRLGALEHMIGYLLVLGTIGLGALCILVGFDAFDNGNTQQDGVLWGLAAIATGVLSAAHHTVRQHAASEEDYVLSLVEERVGERRPRRVVTGETAEEGHHHI